MKILQKIVLALLCVAGGTEAQTPKPVEPTELQSVKLELLEVKISALYDKMTPLQTERSLLIQTIERENPGYSWHESTMIGDKEGLRPIPAPAPVSNK